MLNKDIIEMFMNEFKPAGIIINSDKVPEYINVNTPNVFIIDGNDDDVNNN